MGFLRKVGRKIKKGVGKLFSTKLGSIVGMVGLYFVMGAAAKALTGWASSIFGGAGAAGGSTAAAAELTTTVGAEAGAIFEGKVAADAAAAAGVTADKAIVATVSSTGATVESLMANAATNSEKANLFIGAQESSVISGASPAISNTLTEAVGTAATDTTLLSQTTTEVTKNLAQPIDFTDADFRKIYEGSNVTAKEGSQFSKAVTDTDLQTRTLMPKEGVSLDKFNADSARYGTLGPDATFGQQLGRFAQDPIGITRGAIQNTTAEALEYATGPEFIPDTLQGAATGALAQALAPEQEEPWRSGGVAQQPMQELAQASHMQTVSPQLAAAGLGNVRSFQDLANQTLYGTGTPSYLQGIYQPLPLPNIG